MKDRCPRCKKKDKIRCSDNKTTCICDRCNYGMLLTELISMNDTSCPKSPNGEHETRYTGEDDDIYDLEVQCIWCKEIWDDR